MIYLMICTMLAGLYFGHQSAKAGHPWFVYMFNFCNACLSAFIAGWCL